MTAGTVHLTSPITADGQAGPFAVESDVAPLTVVVTAGTVTGTTPSCTFTAQRSLPSLVGYPDVTNAAHWDTANGVAASALTASGSKTIALPASRDASGRIGGWWRLAYTVTGTTPSFAITAATADG